MKSKIKPIALCVGLITLGTISVTGCDGDGGGSGGDGGGNSAPSLTVASVQLGTPICSVDGEGSVDGPLFTGNEGQITVYLDTDHPDAQMRVWMQANVSGEAISHYDWEIIGWQNQVPYGVITGFDEVIDIDFVQGIFKVRSYENKVRYSSTEIGNFLGSFSEQVKVTAWSTNGLHTTAYFTLQLAFATPPESFTGAVFRLDVIDGTGIYYPYGIWTATMAYSGNTYQLDWRPDESAPNSFTSFGTYAYAVTGADTAQMIIDDSAVGVAPVQLYFLTYTTGLYTLGNENGSSSGIFTLLAVPE